LPFITLADFNEKGSGTQSQDPKIFRAKTGSISRHAVRLEELLQRETPGIALYRPGLANHRTRSDYSKQEKID
jgi:hypothetical protein